MVHRVQGEIIAAELTERGFAVAEAEGMSWEEFLTYVDVEEETGYFITDGANNVTSNTTKALTDSTGATETYDRVVFACHAETSTAAEIGK